MNKKAFGSHRPARIHFNFPNGNFLSTIWAGGSYTENYSDWRDTEFLLDKTKTFPEYFSDTVEVMFECGEELRLKINTKYGDGEEAAVIGQLTFSQWLEIVNLLATEVKNV